MLGFDASFYFTKRVYFRIKRVFIKEAPQIKPDPKSHSYRVSLPTETIERVADFLFETPLSAKGMAALCYTKPAWSDVSAFLIASPELHKIGYVRWIKVLTIKSPEDWSIAKSNSRYIVELRCLDGTFDSSSRRILVHFNHLYAVSIDAHSDIFLNTQSQFTYRDLFRALPSSLRRLEITRAHGPDTRILCTVREHCPGLEELRLGRCTIFNSPSACDFWRSFPFDHDSYMSDQGTDSYAHSLAQELFPLRSLKFLRLGLYLVPSTTVLAHRLYHRRGIPAPAIIDWQQLILPAPAPGVDADIQPITRDQLISLLHQPDPEYEHRPGYVCVMCFDNTDVVGRRAEQEANVIIKELSPSLDTIQWMSWLTPGHLGFNSYTLSKSD